MNMIVKILTVAALVSCCVVSMIDAFKPISNHRLELIGTNKLMSVTHRNALTCCIGVSMTALRAGLKKEDEEEYFESDFDKKPLKERLPVAFGFLGAVSLPFIIGLIYLYSNK